MWEWDGGVEVTDSFSFRWLPGRGYEIWGGAQAAAFEGLLWTGQSVVWPPFPRLQEAPG